MEGIFSALICAFTKNGNVHEKGLREIVRYNIDECKVDGLYVNGSTGENFLLSKDEKKKIFEIVKDEARDQVKLIAQVGSINMNEAVELAQLATHLNYDAVSAVTPYYYKFNFDEIKDYYNTIANYTDNNLIIYSIPGLTGVNLNLDQFGELFQNEKIMGVKFTAPDFFLLERLRHRFPEKLIYSGFDEMLLSAAVLNVDGAIGSTFNVNGQRARKIYELAQEGQVEQARSVQRVTNDLISGILKNGIYPSLKELLKLKGIDAGYCRAPFKPLSQEEKIEVNRISQEYL